MADDVDRANETAQCFVDAAIDRARGPGRTAVAVVRNGVTYCKDCSDPIEKNRLIANPKAERCLDCQQDYEIRCAEYGRRA